jgi:hypothetical protein
MIQHWLCYRRYPESRCITLFQSDEQVAAPQESEALAAKGLLEIEEEQA